MADSSEKMPPPEIPPEGTDTSATEPQLTKQEKINIEREQEQKLKAKYTQAARPIAGVPGLGAPGGGAGGGGHSAFLQKRLAKGQKYFDSGDYQMAKQNKPRPGAPGRMMIPVLAQPPTGDTIPTPDTVPARKTSIIQPLHDHSQSMHQASDPSHAGISSLLPPPVTPGQPMPNPAITKLAL
jgi:hypothetical protein